MKWLVWTSGSIKNPERNVIVRAQWTTRKRPITEERREALRGDELTRLHSLLQIEAARRLPDHRLTTRAGISRNVAAPSTSSDKQKAAGNEPMRLTNSGHGGICLTSLLSDAPPSVPDPEPECTRRVHWSSLVRRDHCVSLCWTYHDRRLPSVSCWMVKVPPGRL